MPIEAGARTGATLGGGSPEQVSALGEYALNLGMAFQIIDDVLDITGNEDTLGKPRGMDFIEGKPTLPLILALNHGGNGTRLRKLFTKDEKTEEDVDEAVEYLLQTDILERSKEKAREFSKRAVDALDPISESEYKQGLTLLAEKVVDREF